MADHRHGHPRPKGLDRHAGRHRPGARGPADADGVQEPPCQPIHPGSVLRSQSWRGAGHSRESDFRGYLLGGWRQLLHQPWDSCGRCPWRGGSAFGHARGRVQSEGYGGGAAAGGCDGLADRRRRNHPRFSSPTSSRPGSSWSGAWAASIAFAGERCPTCRLRLGWP